ncbi:MAG TPA: PIN domain-containing protein [Candidatus Saccharimonadales bacterium]|nr:PIN domain-containing protein [Candidatus Saccharimonadales bacterium]
MISKSSDSSNPVIIALDTTAYSQLVRGNSEIATLLGASDIVIMPQPTIAELKSGFAFGVRQEENEANLTRFLASNKVLLVYPDEVTTEYYVAIYSHARRKSRQLSNNDLWIAALSAQYNAELESFDHDFDALLDYEGLRVQVLNDKH